MELSKSQERVLNYIKSYIALAGYPPSYREIAKHCKYASASGVAKVVNQLEKHGLLTRDKTRYRSIGVTNANGGTAKSARR